MTYNKKDLEDIVRNSIGEEQESSVNSLSYIFEDNRIAEFFEDERQLDRLHQLIDELDKDFYDEVIEMLSRLY